MQQKSVNLSNQQVENLAKKVEEGEIDSMSEGIRNALNNEGYGTSDFRGRMDKYGSAAGLLGVALMAMTLFAPEPLRFISLVPFAISFFCYGIGYVYDYDDGFPIHD